MTGNTDEYFYNKTLSQMCDWVLNIIVPSVLNIWVLNIIVPSVLNIWVLNIIVPSVLNIWLHVLKWKKKDTKLTTFEDFFTQLTFACSKSAIETTRKKCERRQGLQLYLKKGSSAGVFF